MASDLWIKVRRSLFHDPKIAQIAWALADNEEFKDWLRGGAHTNAFNVGDAALRDIAVTVTLHVWALARDHGKYVGDDLILDPCLPCDLDLMVERPGITEALVDVGWARVDEEQRTITLVDYRKYNPEIVTSASRVKAFRERQRNATCNVTETVTKRKCNALDRDGDRDEDEEMEHPKKDVPCQLAANGELDACPQSAESVSAKPDRTDWQGVKDRWNAVAAKCGVKPITRISTRRKARYRTRLREIPDWLELVEAELPRVHPTVIARGFICFDWLLSSGKADKFFEGGYRDSWGGNGNPSPPGANLTDDELRTVLQYDRERKLQLEEQEAF